MNSHNGSSTPPASDVREAQPTGLTPVSVKDHQWWNTNLPKEQWTKDCPSYLKDIEEKNIRILSIRDADHPRSSWDEVKSLIDSNHIGEFHRMPSDLRRYIKYCHDLKQKYSSVLYFIQHERLDWPAINPSDDAPFVNEEDYKILHNDWPYSIDQEIVHIVVWTKFALEDDLKTGQLKEENKAVVEDFVYNTFCSSAHNQVTVDRGNLRWFKNWKSLRSVHALEHFHIMLYRPPPELIERVTKGDRPMCEQFEG